MMRVGKPKQAVWILARMSKLVDAIIYFTPFDQSRQQRRPVLNQRFLFRGGEHIPNMHCCSKVIRKLPIISRFTSCFRSSFLPFYRTLSSISIFWTAFFGVCLFVCWTYHHGVNSLSFLLLPILWFIHVENPSYPQKKLTSGDRQNLSKHPLLPYYFYLIICLFHCFGFVCLLSWHPSSY